MSIFSEITTAQKVLYTKDTIPFLDTVFKVIWVDFDPSENIKPQLVWKTKEEYEKILEYLKWIILKYDPKDLDWSVRFVFSKNIEKEIFKNLEFFHYYNLYKDEERRNIKEFLENAIFQIYKNDVKEKYLLHNEVNLYIDWEKKENVEKDLASIKKNKYITVNNNLAYNHRLLANEENPVLVKEAFDNVWNYTFSEPEIKNIELSKIDFIIKDLKSPKIIEKEEILRNFLAKNDFLYLNEYNFIRQYESEKTRIILDLNTLSRLDSKTFTDWILKYHFSDDIKYYDSINAFKLELYWQQNLISSNTFSDKKISKKMKKFKEWKYNLGLPGIDINWNKLYEIINIKEIEINGRVYKDQKDIYEELKKVNEYEIIKVLYSDWVEKFVSKNLNLFIFLNWIENTIKYIQYWMIKRNIDDTISFNIKGIDIRKFNEFVQTFFEYIWEDYEREYQDKKIIEVQADGFNKALIKKYERFSKYKYEFIENTTQINKFIKNLT